MEFFRFLSKKILKLKTYFHHFLKFMVHEFFEIHKMLSNWDFFVFYRKNLKTQNIIFYSKILNLKKKYHSPKIFENQCPTIFWKSMSHDFLKFMVHDFLKINVPRFFEIHSPRFFEIQCPKDFCEMAWALAWLAWAYIYWNHPL